MITETSAIEFIESRPVSNYININLDVNYCQGRNDNITVYIYLEDNFLKVENEFPDPEIFDSFVNVVISQKGLTQLTVCGNDILLFERPEHSD